MENWPIIIASSIIGALLILSFGIKAFVSLQNTACETLGFEKAMTDIGEEIRKTKSISLEKKPTSVMCVDEAIFVDLNKVNKSHLAKYPAIKNSVEGGSKNNVFLMKDKKIKSAFEAGSIETPYPYFLCVKPVGNKLNLFMEGKGNRTRITTDCSNDCTPIVVSANVDKIRAEASAIGENVGDATDKIELKRKFCRFNESFTKVEITIKAKDTLTDLKYIEYLPKECIDDLNAYLESVVIPPYYKIKADPLIMWHFADVRKGKEEKITYVLKIELSDYCKELISGMGIIDERNNGPYLFNSFPLPYTTLFVGDSLTLNLDEHFKDSDPDIEQLTYDAVYDVNYVNALTSTPTRSDATITGLAQTTPETEITFTAKDYINPDFSAGMKVRVLAFNTCLDNDGDGFMGYDAVHCPTGNDCDDTPSGSSIHPGATDIACDTIDQDCSNGDAQDEYDCFAQLTASASANPSSGTAPLSVQLSCSASGGTMPYAYSWDFGDSSASPQQNPQHSYSAGGYVAVCTVTDSDRRTSRSTATVTAASTSCSGLTSTTCESNANCDWCSNCNANQYSGGNDRCVDSGTCAYGCTAGQCGAECILSESQSQSCGNCGTKTRTCQSNCQWGTFGICTGEDVCSPNTFMDTSTYYCSGNNVYLRRDICSNSCQWYDDGSASDTVQQDCAATGQICSGGSCVNAVASLSASATTPRENEGSPPSGFISGNWWYYDVTLKETSGNVGVTIQSRQKCYHSSEPRDWCDPEKTSIGTYSFPYNIPAGSQINANNQWAWFYSGYTYTITETFWGIDGNGNNMQVNYMFTVVS